MQMPRRGKPIRKKRKGLAGMFVADKAKKRDVICPLCPFSSSSDFLVVKHFFEAHWIPRMDEPCNKACSESSASRSVTRQRIRDMFKKYSHRRIMERKCLRIVRLKLMVQIVITTAFEAAAYWFVMALDLRNSRSDRMI